MAMEEPIDSGDTPVMRTCQGVSEGARWSWRVAYDLSFHVFGLRML
jgi:hypothetical protein